MTITLYNFTLTITTLNLLAALAAWLGERLLERGAGR